jgi:NAD(P)-dependent dehydrogenase (short-subunit alcohol dehydrogenase family)
MTMAFAGKVALVTGAGSGMGRLASRRLADAGVAVAALDINEEGLRETAEGRESVRPQVVDVTDAAAVTEAVERTESELGPIERVLNAAAIMPTALLMDQDLDVIHRIMDINYGGVVNVATATLRKMLERGRGDLVNFASLAGWIPLEHFGAYNASKFAVVAYTEVLAHENRDRGVRFACVCPPPVATPLLDQAESKPKILEQSPPLRPEQVLEAIDKALDAGRFWVFPGLGSTAAWRARRFLPNLVWKYLHRIERP